VNVNESITEKLPSIKIVLSPVLFKAGKELTTIIVASISKKSVIVAFSARTINSSGSIVIGSTVIVTVSPASANCQLAKLNVLEERL